MSINTHNIEVIANYFNMAPSPSRRTIKKTLLNITLRVCLGGFFLCLKIKNLLIENSWNKPNNTSAKRLCQKNLEY